ncbi:hypothetical protein ACFQDF_14815 [Ectobacillus funiculus]
MKNLLQYIFQINYEFDGLALWSIKQMNVTLLLSMFEDILSESSPLVPKGKTLRIMQQ